MPTRNISLALQQRRREDALKLKALRTQIKAGVDALERGEFIEIDESDLGGYLQGGDGDTGRRRALIEQPSERNLAYVLRPLIVSFAPLRSQPKLHEPWL
jgi:hypothetical protein